MTSNERDLVERLRARVARSEPEGFVEVHIDFLTEAADALASIRAERDAAVEALKPITTMLDSLGEYADEWPDDKRVDCRHYGDPYNDFIPLTYGDLRRAARAIAGEQTNDA